MPPGTVGVHHLESIRNEVRQRLADFGAPVGDSMAESCLLQDNSYCGRRFTLGGFQAVWFLEENEVKFYAPSGELLGSDLIGKAAVRPQVLRRAA